MFEEDEQLYSLARHCLSKTIADYIALRYFADDYASEPIETLYTKVQLSAAYSLFSKGFLQEMASAGVQVFAFVPKKIAQLLTLLNEDQEQVPDLFLEYILYKMIVDQAMKKFDYITVEPDTINALKKQLRVYAKEYLDINSNKERKQFVTEHVTLLTQFSCLLGIDVSEEYSLVFWDWDYAFFEEWGFAKTILEAAYGSLARQGYGVESTQAIFSSVGEEIPRILRTNG